MVTLRKGNRQAEQRRLRSFRCPVCKKNTPHKIRKSGVECTKCHHKVSRST